MQIAPSSTILDLKQLCTEKTQLPAESQRLIFKGKKMQEKNDDNYVFNLTRLKSAYLFHHSRVSYSLTNNVLMQFLGRILKDE